MTQRRAHVASQQQLQDKQHRKEQRGLHEQGSPEGEPRFARDVESMWDGYHKIGKVRGADPLRQGAFRHCPRDIVWVRPDSPSPQPSPPGEGDHLGAYCGKTASGHSDRVEPKERGQADSLSPGERVRVRAVQPSSGSVQNDVSIGGSA